MHTQTNIFQSLKNGLLISLLAIVLSHSQLFAQESRLLFKSSFGGTTALDKTGFHELFGSENGYEWPYDIPGDNYRVGEGSESRFFNYIISDQSNYLPFVDTRIDNVTVPGSTATKALYMEFKADDTSASSMTRNNYAFKPDLSSSDSSERYDQMYFKYKMKQHILQDGLDWKNIAEMKSEGGDFRWTLYVAGIGSGKLKWQIQAQDGVLGGDPMVYIVSSDGNDVPLDEWFDLEFFVVHSTNPSQGKIKLAINGVVVLDITDRTLKVNPPRSFWALKNYGAVGWQLITDFEMYSAPPTSSVLNTSYQADNPPAVEPDNPPVTQQGSFILSPGVLK